MDQTGDSAAEPDVDVINLFATKEKELYLSLSKRYLLLEEMNIKFEFF